MKRKNFSSKFKSKVATEAIKGHKTINELTTEFSVHATQINAWKKLLLEGSEDILAKAGSSRLRATKKRKISFTAR